MKVLIVHPQMKIYGGAELVITRLAHYLKNMGDHVSIVTLSTFPHKDYEGLDIIVPDKQTEYRLRGNFYSIKSIYGIYYSLKVLCKKYSDDYDVINAHNFPSIWATPPQKNIVWQANEIPDIWHNGNINPFINYTLNIGRYMDGVISSSKNAISVVSDDRMADIFKQRYKYYPNIIPYGIDGQYYAQKQNSKDVIAYCNSLGIYSYDFNIIQPSMISPSKNQFAILKALKLMVHNGKRNIKLIFAGYKEDNNPYTLLLYKYIKENNLSSNVLFVGNVNREKLRMIYNVSKVAVFSGKGQGSWLSPFEALSTNVPIIVSPNLTCSSLIHQQGIGIVSEDIINSLNNIYYNYDEAKELATKGKEYVLKNLTWDKYSSRMRELLICKKS